MSSSTRGPVQDRAGGWRATFSAAKSPSADQPRLPAGSDGVAVDPGVDVAAPIPDVAADLHDAGPRPWYRQFAKVPAGTSTGRPKQPASLTCQSCRIEVAENNGNWRGGKTYHKSGYVMRRVPGPPRARPKSPYVFEHVLVMEDKLGRPRRVSAPPQRSEGRQPDREPRAVGPAAAEWDPGSGRSHVGARSARSLRGGVGQLQQRSNLRSSALGAGGNRTGSPRPPCSPWSQRCGGRRLAPVGVTAGLTRWRFSRSVAPPRARRSLLPLRGRRRR
jgi:hypothetical protein